MEECKHQIATKIENGYVVTYCKKCGKILDTKPLSGGSEPEHWKEGLIHDNGGQILHD